MNTPKPHNCPCCGSKTQLCVAEQDDGYRATIYCTADASVGCFLMMSHWALKKTWAIESVTKAWNRRAVPTNQTQKECSAMERVEGGIPYCSDKQAACDGCKGVVTTTNLRK